MQEADGFNSEHFFNYFSLFYVAKFELCVLQILDAGQELKICFLYASRIRNISRKTRSIDP